MSRHAPSSSRSRAAARFVVAAAAVALGGGALLAPACSDTVTLGARDQSIEAPRDAGGDGARDVGPDTPVGDGAGDACSPPPSCNWCGGTNVTDSAGCVIGYRCANGVDPCTVSACTPSTGAGCGPGERCQADGLCWPDSDAGATGTFSCGATLRCSAASEYCRADAPQTCQPLPDGGACPVNCKQAACGQPTPQCVCVSYRCEALPQTPPCSDCSCLTVAGCTCIATGSGLLLKCQP